MTLGRIDSNGVVTNNVGSTLGYIRDGVVTNNVGSTLGYIRDGVVTNNVGSTIGYIRSNGEVADSFGASRGNVGSMDNKTAAAAMFFFFFKDQI